MTTFSFVQPAVPKSAITWPTTPDWVHEVKFDGWRVQVHADGRCVRLYSRRGVDITTRFASVAASIAEHEDRFLLDGELVAVDDRGHCDFVGLNRPTRPVLIRAFDLLHHRSADLTPRPLVERQEKLRLLVDEINAPLLKLSDHFDDATRLFEAVERLGLEGIVSKKKSSTYRPGTACGWIKVKTKQWRDRNRERWRQFGT